MIRRGVHSDGAFAMLVDAAPMPASSGMTTRHRLNRHGDWHLNCPLHIIAIRQRRHDHATQAFFERGCVEGKTDREIRRCLKLYIVRELYRTIESGLDSQ